MKQLRGLKTALLGISTIYHKHFSVSKHQTSFKSVDDLFPFISVPKPYPAIIIKKRSKYDTAEWHDLPIGLLALFGTINSHFIYGTRSLELN